jgi:3-ketosteroid 9alpha-monooxygenase subunit B
LSKSENDVIIDAVGLSTGTTQAGVAHDHGFHELRVKRVVTETAEAASFVLEVPAELEEAYRYAAGQFCTFRVEVDGVRHLRCYSMSSSPDVDDELQVTVKRVPGGVVSNWMIEHLAEGDPVETTRPAGVFRLGGGDVEVVAFAAGSGITPVFSIVKTALATTGRRVRLLYANRDRESVIFDAELRHLVDRFGDRLEVTHHLDVDRGFVDDAAVRAFLGEPTDAESFICGPGPFMDIVEGALLESGVPADRIRIERFTPAAPVDSIDIVDDAESGVAMVTIEIDGKKKTVEHRAGTTILQTARQLDMKPPSSCESGSCATCMGKLLEGTVSMFVNNALTDDEVDEGFILTCQSVPTSDNVHVVYGYE